MKNQTVEWYMENRMEYLSKKLEKLRAELDRMENSQDFDYDRLKDFLETRGRLKEVQYIQQRLAEMGAIELPSDNRNRSDR